MARTAGEVQPLEVDLDRYSEVIDVRPATIRARCLGRSRNVPLDQLLADPDTSIATDGRVLVVCDVGMRSRIAAERLRAIGIAADSLAGGIEAWVSAGLPVEETSPLGAMDRERYDRHIKLAEFGVSGQVAVSRATVTVVGTGGLGIPVAQYLAAAGVGTLRLVDDDDIELSNLHRQTAYRSDDVGRAKVEVLARGLESSNPAIGIEPMAIRLTHSNAERLLAGSDVVVDATDDFAARYAINDACQRLGVPDVFAAVYRWEGQIAVFPPGGPCYRCVFPRPPDSTSTLDCDVIGVLGSVVGTLGAMQATDAIRLLIEPPGERRPAMTIYDGRDRSTHELTMVRRADCPACGAP